MKFDDQVVIVTGGGHGIGRAYCHALASRGARVVAADIDLEAVHRTVEEIRQKGGNALGIRTDVAEEKSTLDMARSAENAYGRIDILVNNAAVFATIPISRLPFDKIPLEEWDVVMKVNLKGPFLCCRAVAPIMRKQKRGKIVNIASSTIFKGTGGRIHYVASKAGIIGLTRVLARELGDDNICVNTVAPGNTLSEEVTDGQIASHHLEAVKYRCFKRIQLPEDLLGIVLFLSSSESDFITGQTICVDGGDIFF